MGQLSDGLAGGMDELYAEEQHIGDASELHFTMFDRATAVSKVYNWVGGSTNAWTEKTETTHWTHTLPVNSNPVITYEAGNAPIASVKEKWTVTFPAVSVATSGDFFYMDDATGARWGISLDKTGSAAEPTSTLWTAITAGKKVHVNVSAATTGADVAAAVETAFDALTGVTTKLTTTTTSAAIAFEVYTAGDYSGSTAVKNAAGSGVGSITKVRTTFGKTATMKIVFLKNLHCLTKETEDGMSNG